MAEIKLLTVKNYATLSGVSRQTIWRWTKEGSLDYYVLITEKGKSRKLFAIDEPNKRMILDLGPTIL
ncbi:MAG: hypothetical protein A2172_00180 [Candidatus Woykebacteria bacterium RBG_13_40_15]|uniref:Helix-turn-helix domain-containing protein n=1 Tax=Candidatus Woykebacteria bacterium RBG_13_40_15 TaxID=1802593 RepID=A0A1G1W9B2_9BACT|nr:MAG: hypothetical protein A2172_00180 [Candidatus Woykebacteria bacterium RBG_13_40_15]